MSYYHFKLVIRSIIHKKFNSLIKLLGIVLALVLLNSSTVKWVVIAFITSTPVVWLAMNSWLESFVYQINLSWWIFVVAGLATLVIALLTVSWQSYKAATRNPVEALRYE